MKSREITTAKFAIFKGTKVRKVIFQNEWWFLIALSTICRQLAEHIEFDVFNDSKRYCFNYGRFAINRLPTIEDLSIVQNLVITDYLTTASDEKEYD